MLSNKKGYVHTVRRILIDRVVTLNNYNHKISIAEDWVYCVSQQVLVISDSPSWQ